MNSHEENTTSPQRPDAPGPLSGIRVLDFTRILSGPFATMNLADLGADVIKIERPDQGDDTRQWGPPFQGDQAAYFLSVNRNKRSVALDLKSPEGARAIKALAERSDVIVENFRPGTMARLGLGYEAVSRANPRVIYASISGYGQTGPDASRAGYDAIAQARSGLMSVTGEPKGPPVRVGISPADLTAGMWALVGILSALYQREQSGHGQWIDVSLLDGQVSWLTYVAQGYFASGHVPRRYGSAHPTIAPYQGFPTQDGNIMIAVGNDGLWKRLAEALDLASLIEDPRFVHNSERVTHRTELVAILTETLKTKTTDAWIAILDTAGVPVGPINTVDQALKDPQIAARGMVTNVEHPGIGSLDLLNCPIKMSANETSVRMPPPLLGQHTKEVLEELGLANPES
jgi:formyl-CoA transferase/CoA:oxalate CoA-transferase